MVPVPPTGSCLVSAFPSVTVLINSTTKYQLGTQQRSRKSERTGDNSSLGLPTEGLGTSGELSREQAQNEQKQVVLHYRCSEKMKLLPNTLVKSKNLHNFKKWLVKLTEEKSVKRH